MRKNLTRPRSIVSLMLFGLILSFAIWTSCGEQVQSPSAPQEAQEELVLSPENPQVQSVMQVQMRHTATLLQEPGIVGTATGMTEDGQPAIIVFAESDVLAKGAALPATLRPNTGPRRMACRLDILISRRAPSDVSLKMPATPTS